MTPGTTTANAMKQIRALGLVLMAILVLPISAMGQSRNDVRLLSPREEQRLKKEAREAYRLGVKALDHVDAVLAIQQLDKASQLDLDALELHYLTARLAHLRGRRVYGEEASRYYDLALQALDRVGKKLEEIGKTKKIAEHVTIRYQTQVRQLTNEKKALAARNDQRLIVGLQFRRIYAMERFDLTEEGEPKPEPKPKPSVRPLRRGRPPYGPGRGYRGGGVGGAGGES